MDYPVHFPYSTDTISARENNCLPKAIFPEIIPEPYLTEKRFLKSTNENGKILKLKEKFPAEEPLSDPSLPSTKPSTFKPWQPWLEERTLHQNIFDEGIMTTESKFSACRLPGYKRAVNLLRLHDRSDRLDDNFTYEPRAIENLSPLDTLPSDAYQRQIDASVTDHLHLQGCLELPCNKQFSHQIAKDPASINCDLILKNNVRTRNYLMWAGRTRDNYPCRFNDRKHRVTYKAPIDVQKQTKDGKNLQYFFSATFEYASNIKPGQVFDHVKNLAYHREQVLPKQNENFKSEIKHFEFFVGKSTTAEQRSKTLLSECKKNGQQNNFPVDEVQCHGRPHSWMEDRGDTLDNLIGEDPTWSECLEEKQFLLEQTEDSTFIGTPTPNISQRHRVSF